jgi:Rrf2 family nitric oxide-sensitive transcriptional repressor
LRFAYLLDEDVEPGLPPHRPRHRPSRIFNDATQSGQCDFIDGLIGPGEQMNVETMAQQRGDLLRNRLHEIVQDLAPLGVWRTIRGAGGGVTLAAPLEDTRRGSLVRSLDSDQALVECFRGEGGFFALESGSKLRAMLRDARETFYRRLDQHTLAECVSDRRQDTKRAIAAPKSPRRSRDAKSQSP